MGISQVQVSRMERKSFKFKRDDALRNRIVKGIVFSWMSDTKVRIKVGG